MLIIPFNGILNLFNTLMGYLRQFFGWLVNIESGPLSAIIKWISGLIDKLSGFFIKFKDWFTGDPLISKPSEAMTGAGGTSNTSTTNIAIDSPITINGVDANNAPIVAAVVRSAVAIEIKKILVEAGI